MRVLESWDVFLTHRFRVEFEVGMLNSIDSVDAFSPIQFEKFAKQGDGSGSLFSENL